MTLLVLRSLVVATIATYSVFGYSALGSLGATRAFTRKSVFSDGLPFGRGPSHPLASRLRRLLPRPDELEMESADGRVRHCHVETRGFSI